MAGEWQVEVDHDVQRLLAVEWTWENMEHYIVSGPPGAPPPKLHISITDMGELP